jgi:hypothetical protein
VSIKRKWSKRIVALAQAHGCSMTMDEAGEFLDQFAEGLLSKAELLDSLQVGIWYVNPAQWTELANQLNQKLELCLDSGDWRRAILFGHGLPRFRAQPLNSEKYVYLPPAVSPLVSGSGYAPWPRRTGACAHLWAQLRAHNPMLEPIILDTLWERPIGLVLVGCRSDSRLHSVCIAQEVISMTQALGPVARFASGVFGRPSKIQLEGLSDIPVVESFSEADGRGVRRILVDLDVTPIERVLHAAEHFLIIGVQSQSSVEGLIECGEPLQPHAASFGQMLIAAVGVGVYSYKQVSVDVLDIFVRSRDGERHRYGTSLQDFAVVAGNHRFSRWEPAVGEMWASIDAPVERSNFFSQVLRNNGFTRGVSYFQYAHRRAGERAFIVHADDVDMLEED